MKVKQFRYSEDNLGYLVYSEKSAIAIDGGAVDEIVDFINTNNLDLKYITNTHSHMDHTVGNFALAKRYISSKHLDNKLLIDRDIIELDKEKIKIFKTPGHTLDSVCFYIPGILITGDTLFNGKLGRCFSGDLKKFYNSVKLLMKYSDDTIIYAGHDYVEEYMDFAQNIEPDNKYIDIFIEKYDPCHVYSTLKDEFQINPHLRFNDSKMISILKAKGLSVETEYLRFQSVMAL